MFSPVTRAGRRRAQTSRRLPDLATVSSISRPTVVKGLVGLGLASGIAAAIAIPVQASPDQVELSNQTSALVARDRAEEIATWGRRSEDWIPPHDLGPLPPDLRERAAVEVVEARVVDDGDVITAGAPACGIDLALHVLERIGCPALADAAARELRYERPAGGVLVPGLQPVGQRA